MEDIEQVFDLGYKALERGNFEPLVNWVGVRSDKSMAVINIKSLTDWSRVS